VQAVGRKSQTVPDGALVHYERHRPEQTTLNRLVQQHTASFIAHTEASTGAELPRFIKDECDAFLECGILTHGFLRLRCGECGHDKLLAYNCKRRGICPSCGARRMSQTAAHLVDHVVPGVPVKQWVLSLPIPLRVLLAAQPGHFTYGCLHGGVISLVRDAMAGLALMVAIAEQRPGESALQVMHRFARMGTFDLRIDFLRQGLGRHFDATARVTRPGGRIGSTQMALHNEGGELITTGAAAFAVSWSRSAPGRPDAA
jgi:acyl-coenzyme A thioesterase PaaI-like protein